MIPARTRAVLAAEKADGVQLGNPRLLAQDLAAFANDNAVQMENAERCATVVLPTLDVHVA